MMGKTDSQLMQMLSTNMRHLSQRQVVLSQNIANIDTPDYRTQDLKKLDFNNLARNESNRLEMRAASYGQSMAGLTTKPRFASEENRNPFEVSPVGNNVNLEDEMAKISRTGADYQVSSSLYKKFTTLYRTALGTR